MAFPQQYGTWKIIQLFLHGSGNLNKWSEVKAPQLYLTLCDAMDYTVHAILQARILDSVAFPFSRGSSQPRDWTQVSHIAGRFFTSWATREAQEYWSGQPIPSPADLPDPGIKLESPALQEDSLPTELWGKPKTVLIIPLNPIADPQGHRVLSRKSQDLKQFFTLKWYILQVLCSNGLLKNLICFMRQTEFDLLVFTKKKCVVFSLIVKYIKLTEL